MKSLSPNEIRRAVHGLWLRRGTDALVEGVSIDSRTAQADDLFVAVKGERHDGHDHLQAAATAGCILAIVDRQADLPDDALAGFAGGVIGVEDTVKALGELSGYYRGQVPATVIAVTGSNGKTTVKRMIHHIISRRRRGLASEKSFNNAIGVPLTLLAVSPTDDYVVCEIGTNSLGEVLDLARMARPDIAVITSVSEAHLEGLGSVERVAVEKASLLAPLADNGMAVLCGDCVPLSRAVTSYDCRMIRFGAGDECELRLTGYEATPAGQRFRINDRLWVDLPVLGKHNALNAMAAMAVAQRLGFSQDEAAEALADFSGMAMRLQPVQAGPVLVINDAYNANPASMLAAAEVLRDTPAKRRVLVLGDMLELGGRAEELHRQVGRQIARDSADMLIGVGELGKLIAESAAAEGLATETFEDTAAAMAAVAELIAPGDVVLVKGSRGMEMQRVVEQICENFA